MGIIFGVVDIYSQRDTWQAVEKPRVLIKPSGQHFGNGCKAKEDQNGLRGMMEGRIGLAHQAMSDRRNSQQACGHEKCGFQM
jgi:hypothetical protein